jgi:hypothetical protein
VVLYRHSVRIERNSVEREAKSDTRVCIFHVLFNRAARNARGVGASVGTNEKHKETTKPEKLCDIDDG